jgi:hypothetical protein
VVTNCSGSEEQWLWTGEEWKVMRTGCEGQWLGTCSDEQWLWTGSEEQWLWTGREEQWLWTGSAEQCAHADIEERKMWVCCQKFALSVWRKKIPIFLTSQESIKQCLSVLLKFRDNDDYLFFSFDVLPVFDILLLSTRNIWDPDGVKRMQKWPFAIY